MTMACLTLELFPFDHFKKLYYLKTVTNIVMKLHTFVEHVRIHVMRKDYKSDFYSFQVVSH